MCLNYRQRRWKSYSRDTIRRHLSMKYTSQKESSNDENKSSVIPQGSNLLVEINCLQPLIHIHVTIPNSILILTHYHNLHTTATLDPQNPKRIPPRHNLSNTTSYTYIMKNSPSSRASFHTHTLTHTYGVHTHRPNIFGGFPASNLQSTSM